MKIALLTLALSLSSFALAQPSTKAAPKLATRPSMPSAGPIANADETPTLSKERIVFRTNVGDIAVALYPVEAPQTSAQILALARKGLFDGVAIYRIEPGFVAQTQNYDVKQPAVVGDQLAAVHKIPLEANNVHHRRGILSMARYDEPNSAETSFSFVLGDSPHLDHQYTGFGEVVAGQDVLAEFEKHATDGADGKPRLIQISSADVYEDGVLTDAKLTPAHDYETPDATESRIFLIFAICAFSLTVLKPMVTTVLEKKKAA